MLSIFILVSAATTFARLAHDKNRNRYLWGTIGVASYFLTQIIVGILIGLVKPELLEENRTINIIGIACGFMGIGIAYYILKTLPDPTVEVAQNADLLDSHLD